MKWSSAWGAACDPCARAKTRCIRQQGTDEPGCNRCLSLEIACHQQIRKPRKRRQQRASPALQNATPQQPFPGHGAVNDHSSSPSSPVPRGKHQRPAGSVVDNSSAHNHAASSQSNLFVAHVKAEPNSPFDASTTLPGFHPFPTPTCTCVSPSEGDDEPGPTALTEPLLAIYRDRLSPQYPFVIIPDNVTAVELHETRPLLAKAVKMIATLQNRRSMWNQSKSLLRDISQAVFMDSGRSLDLLQSVIVFLGFYHYFCFAHGHFNSLAHLASGMIADLRLDRPQARPTQRNQDLQGIDPEAPRVMSNDERRAVLAVWYLNSNFAVAYKKVNAGSRHFTKHMERLLQELQSCNQHETDHVLSQLICAQRVNEAVAQIHQSDHLVDVRPSPEAWAANLETLLDELNTLRTSNEQRKVHRYLVSSHYHFALLQILEPHLLEPDHRQHYEAATSGLKNTPDYFREPSLSKKEAADTALRAWFDDWLTVPVCHFFYMPMSGYLHLTNAVVVLLRRARLVLLTRYRQGNTQTSDSNPQLDGNPSLFNTNVSETTDDLMLDLLARLASRFEEARIEMAAAHCSAWENDVTDLVSWKLRERKGCIEKWANVIAKETTRGAEPAPMSQGLPELSMMESGFNAFQGMDQTSMWLNPMDPLEALLLGGGDVCDSWL